jgi:CHAD domain-containing protein
MPDTEQPESEVSASPPDKPKGRPARRLIEIIPVQIETLRTHHRAVLETGGIQAVHKMRVTTRRLQAALDLLAREIKTRKLKRRLRHWRRALSQVRNYDVFLELIEKESPSRGRERREQLQLIKEILQERREARATKVRKFLGAIDIEVIADRLGAPSASIGESTQLNDETTSGVDVVVEPQALSLAIDQRRVAGYAAERLDQRLGEFQTLAAASQPTNDPAELHQLRIAAKRVRYLLEIVSELGYGDASHALVWLRTLQDRIGDWHDLEALEEEIVAIVTNREFLKRHLSDSSQMLEAAAHLQKKKEVLVKRLFPVRVPRYLEITSQRLARALRRHAARDR